MRVLYCLLLIAFLSACKKKPEIESMMESKYVVLKENSINDEHCKLSAQMSIPQNEKVTEYGFVYALDGSGPLINQNSRSITFPGSQLPQDGLFNTVLDVSIPDCEYAIRAYVIFNEKIFYSSTFRYKNGPRGTWKRLNNFPGPWRSFPVCFSLNNKGYVGLGYGTAGSLKDFWEFDPSTNQWKQLPDFPGEARSAAFQFVIGNKSYIGGGCRDNPVTEYAVTGFDDLWEFDPATTTWKRLADVPQNSTLAYDAVGTYSFSLGGFGFVGGGRISFGINYAIFKYDPAANTWSFDGEQKDQYNELNGVIFGSCFTLGDTAYIGTGMKDFRPAETSDRFFKYEYKTKKWERGWFPGQKKVYGFGTSNSNTGLIGLGEQTQEIWQMTGQFRWKAVSRCPDFYLNKGGMVFTIGNKTYIGLGTPGLDFLEKNSIYEYTHTR